MTTNKKSFPILVHGYLAYGYGLIIFSPLLVAAAESHRGMLPNNGWTLFLSLSILLAFLAIASDKFISTEKLTYHEGLLYITSYSITGWFYSSMIVVLLVLFCTYIYSIGLTFMTIINRDKTLTSSYFYKFIMYIHSHRARQ